MPSKGRQLLHFAAETGSLRVVKILDLLRLVSTVNVNMPDGDGRTPVMIAASRGYADIVNFLIIKGNSLNEERQNAPQDATVDSLLHLAAREGHPGVVKVLIKFGADVNCRTPAEKGGLTVLHSAVLGGNTEVVKLLCARGANPCRTDSFGKESPFHLAARNGHIDVVRTFIDMWARLDLCDEKGRTPLAQAVLGGNTEIVKLLCANGADQFRTDDFGVRPFHWAAYKGHIDIVQTFIDIGADVNCQMPAVYGRFTVLHAAVLGGNNEVVKLLCANGADQSLTDTENIIGRCPFHLAAEMGHIDIVRTFVDIGSDLEMKGEKNGCTALFHAAKGQAKEVVAYLLKCGADVDSENKLPIHVTPLMEACLAGSPSVVEHLIAHGADVNKADVKGRTALHRAMPKKCSKEMTLQLIAAGAKINARDEDGNTPLQQFGDVEILARYGAELITDASQPSFSKGRGSRLCRLVRIGRYEDARSLVLAGLVLRQEKWMNLPGKSAEHNNFLAWLRSQITAPKSLTCLCRDSIRQTLIQLSDGKEIVSKVAQLPVPRTVMSFLNLDDI